jgi:hypothetical protein
MIKTKLIFLILALSIVACKKRGSSNTKTRADSKNLKTGFFAPKLAQSLSYGNPKRISDPMKLMEEIGFKYTRNPGDLFLVATTTEGENILVVSRAERSPAPLASLDAKGTSYFWSAAVVSDAESKINLESNLFVRHATGEEPIRKVSKNGDESNMFFIRTPTTSDMSREPMLVNWVDHIVASGNLLYRVGNYVYQQGHESPILRYKEIGNQVWQLEGDYADNDIKSGSVFWSLDGVVYYSGNAGSDKFVEWKKQDKDSMDRVGERQMKDIRIPSIVKRTLESSKGLSLSENSSRNFPGIDSAKPYKGTIPLIQSDAVFQARAKLNATEQSSEFGLASEGSPSESSSKFDHFFEPLGTPDSAGFALGNGKISGLPVFDPKAGYPYGSGIQNKENWVQIEQPPGSGIYRAAIVRQQGSTSRKNEGYIYDSQVNQKKTKLQILEQDGSGGFKPNGVVANLTTEGSKTIDSDWSHIAIEKAKVIANQEREAQEAAQAKERFAFKSGEGQARIEAADENYKKFAKQYTLEENLKYVANEAISGSAKKLNLDRAPARDFQELLQRKTSETITRIGTETIIDAPRAIANGSVPINTQTVLDSASKTLLDTTAIHHLPIKLPSGITKDVVSGAQSVITGFAAKASNYAIGKGVADTPESKNSSEPAEPMSSREKGRKEGEYRAGVINTTGEMTQGVMDIGFAAVKQGVDSSGDPNSIIATRVIERGAQIGRQGAQTAGQYNGARSAFIDANQALKPYENDRYNNGPEGQQALAEMESSAGRSLKIPAQESLSSGSPRASGGNVSRDNTTGASNSIKGGSIVTPGD